jgi:hypothetical protein
MSFNRYLNENCIFISVLFTVFLNSIRIDPLYVGGFRVTIAIILILYIIYIAPTSCPLSLLPPTLKQFQEVLFTSVIYIYEVHQSYAVILISTLHSPASH